VLYNNHLQNSIPTVTRVVDREKRGLLRGARQRSLVLRSFGLRGDLLYSDSIQEILHNATSVPRPPDVMFQSYLSWRKTITQSLYLMILTFKTSRVVKNACLWKDCSPLPFRKARSEAVRILLAGSDMWEEGGWFLFSRNLIGQTRPNDIRDQR